MKINADEVTYVAKLARLNLSDDEVEAMTIQLDRILSYVEKLNELDTDQVRPMTHAIEVQNAFREDKIKDSLGREASLQNAPQHNNEAFMVPKII